MGEKDGIFNSSMIDRAIPLRKSILGEKHGKFKLDRPIQVSSLIKVRLGQGV